MTKKEQTPNRIIVKKKRTSKVTNSISTFKKEMYLDLFTLRERPVSDDYLFKLALEWITVALNDETMLTLDDFLILKGLSRKTMMSWCRRCDVLMEAHNHVTMIIGNRREKGMLTKKLDSTGVLRSMHMYDDRWVKADEWRASLSTKILGAGNTVTIVEMEKFADADLLETKKED